MDLDDGNALREQRPHGDWAKREVIGAVAADVLANQRPRFARRRCIRLPRAAWRFGAAYVVRRKSELARASELGAGGPDARDAARVVCAVAGRTVLRTQSQPPVLGARPRAT